MWNATNCCCWFFSAAVAIVVFVVVDVGGDARRRCRQPFVVWGIPFACVVIVAAALSACVHVCVCEVQLFGHVLRVVNVCVRSLSNSVFVLLCLTLSSVAVAAAAFGH